MTPSFEQPQPLSWMRPHERSLRENAPAYLEKVVHLGLLGSFRVREVELYATGISSVVYKVTHNEGAVVVKMTPEGRGLQRDATFFSLCEGVGIKVPQRL